MLIESISNGLNIIDADPYVYPVITGVVIFIAVLLDSVQLPAVRHIAAEEDSHGTVLPSA